MKKIKVGDRVKIVECAVSSPKHKGKIGVVNQIEGDGDYWVSFSKGSECCASKVKLLPKKKAVGRPKKVVLNKMGEPRGPISSYSVFFKITTLDDGTELIFIPKNGWEWVAGTDDHSIYKRVKK